MPTAEEKIANCKRVQKCIAKKLAKMTEQQKHEYKMKTQESNRKGRTNFVAKKAKLAEEAIEAAVAERAEALYEARKKEAIQAAVLAGAQALYLAEYKATLERDVMAKAMSLAKAMFERASADNATAAAAIGVTVAATDDTAEVTNMESIVAEEQNSIVCTQTPKYNLGKLVMANKTWTGEDYVVVQVLTSLSVYFRDNWHKDELAFIENIGNNGENLLLNGLRKINGNRYEFFILVKDRFASAFRWVLKLSEEKRLKKSGELDESYLFQLTQSIINFATRRARLVPALSSTNFEMHNFGLIVSKGKSQAQDVHIDLGKSSQYQLGMLCSNDAHLTSEYSCLQPLDGDGNELLLSKLWNDIPNDLATKLNGSKAVVELVENFGSLLSADLKREDTNNVNNKLPLGTLLCLPGRVPHCGPQVIGKASLRAVLFFTATPKDDTAVYNPEVQYCRTTLVAEFLIHTWPQLTPDEREYMLSKWKTIGLDNNVDAVNVNLNHTHLKVMATAITKKKGKVLESMIRKLANDSIFNGSVGSVGAKRWMDDRFIYAVPK